MEITRETLINEFGMKESSDVVFPLEKVISLPLETLETNDIDLEEEQEDRKMSICVTIMRNQAELCLSMPDGAILYLCPSSIEELKIFEKCIASWEPNY